MLRIVLSIGLWLLCFAAQAQPSQQQIINTQGREKLILMNQYLAVEAEVDGRAALAFINQIEPSLPLQPENPLVYEYYLYKINALRLSGDNNTALALADRLKTSAKQLNEPDYVKKALLMHSRLQLEMANSDAAKEDAIALLALYSKDEQSIAHGEALLNLANIEMQQNQYSNAYKAMLNSLAMFEGLGDQPHIATVNARIGLLYRTIGDLDHALSHMLKALDIHIRVGSKREASETYNNTAIIFKDLGRYEKAIELHKKSLALKREIGYQRGMIYSMNNLGETSRLKGDLAAAKQYLDEAKALATSLNNDMLLGSNFLYQGRIALQESNLELARSYLERAMAIYNKRHASDRKAEGLVELARLSEMTGDDAAAISQLREAVAAARAAEKNLVLFDAYEKLAKLLHKTGQHAEAFDMLSTYLSERNKLLDLNSQQRIEMLVVSNQVNEAKRSLQLVQQEAALTEARLQNQIAERNMILFASLLSLALVFFLYSRRQQKQQLAMEVAAREAIEEKEQQLSLALWGSGDVLWDWDLRSGNLSHRNAERFEQLPQRLSPTDLKQLKNHIHPDDFDEFEQAIQRILARRDDIFDVNYRVKLQNGDWLWMHDRGKVVERDQNDQPIRLAGTLHDISELKQHEMSLLSLNSNLESHVAQRTHELQLALKDLKSAQDNLIEAEKMASLGRLVAGIAHEINTPIGTATTATTHIIEELEKIQNLYQSGELTEETLEAGLSQLHEGQHLINRGLNRTSRLVEQFKSLATPPSTEPANEFSFQLLVNAAFEQAKVGAELSSPLQLSTGVDQTMRTYFDALMQVMTILLCNVCEHTADTPNAEVKVSISDSPAQYTITVDDNGPGLGDDEMSKVFEPFYTTKRSTGHIGLGLNIAYNIINQVFKGDIRCQPSSLGGACFSLSIPKLT
ncbi:tetratricopeptide repeat protein [Shewanella sp. JM162201]|uniref:histidine kinase n=1 Tax=Shewanella jiangmenensis TaxID=2837387 RepID=A0ABS5V6N3_9GAMM|nr:tetratricopeptide repeat protein [Shewanella jiangmenensis]MBT1446106.1 tetratricopeptide repeat protein [Shewanella jiangmenensis]